MKQILVLSIGCLIIFLSADNIFCQSYMPKGYDLASDAARIHSVTQRPEVNMNQIMGVLNNSMGSSKAQMQNTIRQLDRLLSSNQFGGGCESLRSLLQGMRNFLTKYANFNLDVNNAAGMEMSEAKMQSMSSEAMKLRQLSDRVPAACWGNVTISGSATSSNSSSSNDNYDFSSKFNNQIEVASAGYKKNIENKLNSIQDKMDDQSRATAQTRATSGGFFSVVDIDQQENPPTDAQNDPQSPENIERRKKLVDRINLLQEQKKKKEDELSSYFRFAKSSNSKSCSERTLNLYVEEWPLNPNQFNKYSFEERVPWSQDIQLEPGLFFRYSTTAQCVHPGGTALRSLLLGPTYVDQSMAVVNDMANSFFDYAYYTFRKTLPGSVGGTLRFTYRDEKGELNKSSASFFLKDANWDENMGNWFPGCTIVSLDALEYCVYMD